MTSVAYVALVAADRTAGDGCPTPVTDVSSVPGFRAESRNDDGFEAWKAAGQAMLVRLSGGPDTFSHRQRIHESARDARTCAQCEGPIGEVVVIHGASVRGAFGWSRLLARFCRGCMSGDGSRGTCEGCRRIVIRRSDRRYRRHTFCSDLCRWQVQAASRRIVPEPHPCAGCGDPVTARADARYCSSACRQRAYRARARAEAAA
jgi:hypothetical protein